MASDDLSREPRAPGDPEEVRIITVDEIAEASSRPDVATRLPERDLPPPPPPVMNVGPPTGEHQLLHWTEPATGQVPAVVIGDNAVDDDRASMTDTPRFRSEHDTTAHGDLFADLGSIEPDEPVAERLGALDTDERISDEAYLNFDDVELDPQPRRRGSRRGRASRSAAIDNDPLSAILLPPDLVGPSTQAPPPPPPSVERAERTRQPDEERTSEAAKGRNVPIAVAVGIGMAIVAALLFKAGPAPAMLLIEVVLVAAGFEYFTAMQRSGFRPATLLGLAAVAGLPIACYWKGESAIPAIIVL
ncbi:MAG: hypothetical protein JHC63_04390, partial [Acidimicrobiia bacterium]|nr:hypothetical protein [Acidimicrobiia bacterium]